MNSNEILQAIQSLEFKLEKLLIPAEKDYYTVKEVEKLLGISRSTFDRYRNNGHIKTTNVGRQIRIHKSVVQSIQENGFK